MLTSAQLKSAQIATPLGDMLSIADHEKLYLLEFTTRKNLEKQIDKLTINQKTDITSGETSVTRSIKNELERYFKNELREFQTPVYLQGTDFQHIVWQALQRIPFGQTRSYAELAQAIGQPKAYRAVARANSTNRLAIIIPCHRIINQNGNLGGYAGGITRKQSLLQHEKTQNEKI